MRGLFVKNGVVDNIAVFNELPNGWAVAPDSVGIGWLDNGDGTFSAPVVEVIPPTIAEQISALEVMVTSRNLRGAALGDQFAIDKIQDVENQIAALRA